MPRRVKNGIATGNEAGITKDAAKEAVERLAGQMKKC